MRPALSLLVFTVSSGAGLGLLVWLAIGRLLKAPLAGTALAGASALSCTLFALGLLSSTLHLANRRNAWRALAGWRSSWLAREAVAALAVWPLVAFWLWAVAIGAPRVELLVGLLLVAVALLTVVCTAMIYACLRTVPRWNCWHTRVGYPLFALVSGGLLWWAVLAIAAPDRLAALDRVRSLLTLLLVLAATLKFAHWKRFADRRPGAIGAAQAVGVAGRARLFDAGHTGPTFLTREFGFELDPQRATKLRWAALALAFAVPAMLIGWPAPAGERGWLAAAAAACCLAGLLLERWLFFAEAAHVVRLYHGADRV